MKKNMGTVDRIVRTVLASIIVVLILTKQLAGTLMIVLGILAVVFLLTSAIAFCPLYVPFNISTRKK